ncbi:MAG: hypothetical protein KC613_13980 [Myxococcales bacterium]|nr:hypothetical protein [Myxococcales bacterium]
MPLRIPRAWALAAALVFGLGCGAESDAPSPANAPPPALCPPLAEVAPNALALVRSGALDGVRAFFETGLPDDELTAVLDAGLRVVRALDQAELEALLALADGPLLEQSLPLVRDVLAFVAGEVDGRLRSEVLVDGARLLRTCDGSTLFNAVQVLLKDPALPDLLAALGDTLRLPVVQDLLSADLGGALARPGFTTVVCNILAALIRPGFSVAADVIAPLSGIDLLPLGEPPLSDLLAALDRLLAPDGPVLPALADVVCCDLYGVGTCAEVTPATPLLARDPVFTWLMYDLFVTRAIPFDAALDLAAELGRDPAVAAALAPVAASLRPIAEDPDIRRALVSLLTRLLDPRVAAEVLPELVAVLDAGAVPELLAVVRLIANGCEPEALP